MRQRVIEVAEDAGESGCHKEYVADLDHARREVRHYVTRWKATGRPDPATWDLADDFRDAVLLSIACLDIVVCAEEGRRWAPPVVEKEVQEQLEALPPELAERLGPADPLIDAADFIVDTLRREA